jgi:dolichol kinase
VSDPELGRRAVHASGAAVPGLAVVGVPWPTARAVTILFAAIALALEALRLAGVVDWAIYDRLTRPYERDNLAGYALYAVGMAIVAVAFEARIALPAMFALALGDPVSGLLGASELRAAKRPAAMLAIFGVSLALAVSFVDSLPAAILGAAAATVADGVKPRVAGYVVDDNLTIPVAMAAALWLGVTYLPG